MLLIKRKKNAFSSPVVLSNPLSFSDAVRKEKKIILEDLFCSVFSQFKIINPLEA